MNEPTASTAEQTQASSDPLDAALAGLPPIPNEKAVDAEIAKLEATEAPEEKPAPDDPSRLAVAARRAQRQAHDAKKRLAQAEQAAEARIKAAEAKAETFEALLKGIKSKDGLEALFKHSGVDFNDLAQAYLGIDPKAPSADAKLEALERKLAEREARDEAEREASSKARSEQQAQAAHQRDVEGVQAFVASKPDLYELVQANADRGSIREIVNRANAFLNSNNVQALSEPERIQLLDHFASEVEDELLTQAKDVSSRLSKLKKLNGSGISPHTGKPSETLTNPPDSSEAAMLAKILDTPSATGKYPSSKFLTNEATMSAPPQRLDNPVKHYGDSVNDDIFERLLGQLRNNP